MVLVSNMGMCRLILAAAMCWGTMQGSSVSELVTSSGEACPRHETATCRYSPGNCLCVMDMDSTSYSGAEAFCYKYNRASLASIHSQHQNDILTYLIHNLTKGAWIGLRSNGDGTYMWQDGSNAVYLNLEDSYDENNNTEVQKDTGCFMMSSTTGKWRQRGCGKELGTACSYLWGSTLPPEISTEGPSSAPDQGGGSPVVLIAVVTVVAVLLLVALLVTALVLRYRYRKRRRSMDDAYSNLTNPLDT